MFTNPLPIAYNFLKSSKLSIATSPKTTFFKSIKGHGANVTANWLLFVFY